MKNSTSDPHGRALRKGRFSEINRIYLVTTVTNERVPVFENILLGRILVQTLMSESPRAETLAYTVMPDHMHWLLQLKTTTSLSAVVRNVKSVSAYKINLARRKIGALWQHGFHDHALRNEEDVKSVARYVVANPLRKGIVTKIADYSLWDATWL